MGDVIVAACRCKPVRQIYDIIIPVDFHRRRLAVELVCHESFQCGIPVSASRFERNYPAQAQALGQAFQINIEGCYGIETRTCFKHIAAAIHITVAALKRLHGVVYNLACTHRVNKHIARFVSTVATHIHPRLGQRAGRSGTCRYRIAPHGAVVAVSAVHLLDI